MRLAYAGVLVACLLATLPLELAWPRTRVWARWRRLALSVLPVAAVFLAWDAYAIRAGHWRFDARQTLGVTLPGGIPVEEVAFFLVVPACAVLAFEAVRRARGWPAGDEDGHR